MLEMQQTKMQSVLVVDDEENMRHMLSVLLQKNSYKVGTAASGEEALVKIAAQEFDFVLCDVRMPGMGGLAFLDRLSAEGKEYTIIMMSAYGTIELAIKAMQKGAYDYVSKPFKMDEILFVLRKAEERERLRRENRRLREELFSRSAEASFAGMVGTSQAMQDVFQAAGKVAKFGATVLITGESGTGKELVARGIHALGKGESAAFVAVNCGGIPADLLESEFFGHAKGAFTGADKAKPGLFELADGGTLFLDEIGEMPLDLQVKLLRVLQEGEVRRVGALASHKVQVRILAATNRNLVELVQQGRFREDLFYRLNVFTIHIPPLREHMEDLAPLCSFFLTQLAKSMGKKEARLAHGAQTRLLSHTWPGNVRELKSVLERALILADDDIILPEHLPEQFGAQNQGRRLEDFFGTYSLKKAKKIMERHLIRRAMRHCDDNKSKAAELLEISYPALLDKIKMYSLAAEEKREAQGG